MFEHGYTVANLFNEHYTEDGWLAFADAVFVPKELSEKFSTPFQNRPNASHLLEENKKLQAICEERKELINRLHNTIEEQAELINRLHSAAEKQHREQSAHIEFLYEENKMLLAACDERLELINRLHAEAEKLTRERYPYEAHKEAITSGCF